MKKIHSVLLCLGLAFTFQSHAQVQYTLQQCIDSALVHNRKLQNAALDIRMAGEQKSEAYTKYFPQISANVMAFQAVSRIMRGDGTIPQDIAMLGDQFIPLIGEPIQIRELNGMYNASLSLMQPIFTGGQIRTGNKLAQVQQDAMKLQLEMKERDVVQSVTQNFWQMATLCYNLSTLDAADAQLQAVYDNVSSYVQAGVTTRNDLLKVKLQQQKVASDRLKIENGLHLLRLILAQQCGLTGDGIQFQVPESPLQVKKGETPALPLRPANGDATVQGRQEYQLAQANVKAQQYQARMERGKLLPSLAVGLMGYNAGLGGLSKDARQYMNTSMTNAMVLGTLSIPISDWWGGSHAIRRQKIKVQQAQNDLLEAQEMLSIDLESSWSAVVQAYKQIEIASTSVEQATENLRMSTSNYRAGVQNLADLLDAETLHRQAQNDLSSAYAEYQIALSDYMLKANLGNQ